MGYASISQFHVPSPRQEVNCEINLSNQDIVYSSNMIVVYTYSHKVSHFFCSHDWRTRQVMSSEMP